MKKFLVSVILIAALLSSSAMCAFAAAPSKDGIYQVQIQFRSADDSSEPAEENYFYQTALLEVKGSSKYLTMASLSSIAGFSLYYYTDGSVSGSVDIAEKVSNIKINSRTYPSGYRFPLKGSGQLVGVMLEIPFTPVSVSARIFIDYDSCKLVEETESTTRSSSGSSKLELPTSSGSYTYEYPYALKPNTDDDDISITYNAQSASDETEASENLSSKTTDSRSEKNEVTKASRNSDKDNGNTGVIIGGIVLGVIVIGLAVWVIVAKSKEGKR